MERGMSEQNIISAVLEVMIATYSYNQIVWQRQEKAGMDGDIANRQESHPAEHARFETISVLIIQRDMQLQQQQ